MTIKFILPALAEARSPLWRPIKYSLFPPLGLATLAAYVDDDWEVILEDQHVEHINLNDEPDLVIIQVYITNASRAYKLAEHYKAKGAYICLGGLHVSSLPEEAEPYADSILSVRERKLSPNSCRITKKVNHKRPISRPKEPLPEFRPFAGI